MFHSPLPSPPLPIWPTHLISYVEKRYSVGKKVTRPDQSRPAASLGPALPLLSSPRATARRTTHPDRRSTHHIYLPSFHPSILPSFLQAKQSSAEQREIQHSRQVEARCSPTPASASPPTLLPRSRRATHTRPRSSPTPTPTTPPSPLPPTPLLRRNRRNSLSLSLSLSCTSNTNNIKPPLHPTTTTPPPPCTTTWETWGSHP